MSTSVRWLLAQRGLELELKAGADGVDRVIDCAVGSEPATAAVWSTGGEVILTTGMRLPADRTERELYIDSLDGAGVAALGFGVGWGLDAVPAELCAAADRVGLPLFEVPPHIPFSAITRAVLDQLAAARSARLLAATRAQPRMTRAALARGAAAVVAELADAIDSRVILLDTARAEVAAAPSPADPHDLHQLRGLLARDTTAAGAVYVTEERTITVSRIGSGTTVFGVLGVLGRALDEVARMLVGHAVSLLAIDYAKPREVRRDVARLHADVLGAALDGVLGPATASILVRAAGPDKQVRAAVYAFTDTAAARRGGARLTDELEARRRPVFVLVADREVVILLRGDDTATLAGGLLAALGTRDEVRAGIGAPVLLAGADGTPRPGVVAETVDQARRASRSASTGRIADLDAIRSLLGIDGFRRVLADNRGPRLRPLLDYDRTHATDLEASLLAFLESNGNWGAAAASVGVHRHTLRSRIERVEDLLDVDMADARTRAELLLMMLGAQ